MRIGITERGDGGLDQSWRSALSRGLVDGAIIITKAPHLLLLKQDLPDNTVVHCTITGLGGSPIEPGVIEPKAALAAYSTLARKYGDDRVVLRVDPIFPWEPYLSKALEVIKHWESRVRISYLDMYSHTRRRLEKVGVEIPSGLYNGLHADFETRCKIGEKIAKITLGEFEICGEPGLPCTGCVSKIDLDAMGIDKAPSGSISNQRKSCLCLAEKTELLYKREQCSHKCAYCYWR